MNADRVGADALRWAAEQTWRMHTEPASPDRRTGRCARCLPDGACPLLMWAQTFTGSTAGLTAQSGEGRL